MKAKYNIYKVTRMERGLIMSSEVLGWNYKSLKEAREECKKEHYSWPYYYILRITKQGGLTYKP